jgi:hypothetical protein
MSRILAGTLVVAVAMGGAIYWETQDFTGPDLAAATPARSPLAGIVRPAPGPDPKVAMHEWQTTALARPLFREDRRPPKTSEEVALKGDAPTRLAGVITAPSGNRAIFVSGENAKPVVAKEGAHVSDFVVRSIEPGRVVVESDGMVRTLKVLFSAAVTPPRP